MTDRHPVVGSWRVAAAIPGAGADATNLAAFSADGTVVVAFPSPSPAAPGQSHRLEFFGPAVGSWRPVGERGAAMAFVALGVDENGNALGTHTVTATVEVDADGREWPGPFRIEVASPTGAATGAVDGTVTATRIAAAPPAA